jgi:hypothetical protein
LKLDAHFEKDSALYGDTIDLILSFTNITDTIVKFSKNAQIWIQHDDPKNMFIFHSNETSMYLLNKQWTYDIVNIIYPHDNMILHFRVAINKFFYNGGNKINVIYNLYNITSKKYFEKRFNKKDSGVVRGYISSKTILVVYSTVPPNI